MATRAENLAAQFEAVNQEAIQAVQACSDETWRKPIPDDGRTVGVLAHHMAMGDVPIAELVETIANEKPMPPLTMEMIDQGNAQHAQQFANVTKEETLAALQQNAPGAVAMVRGLSDEQLDRSAEFVGRRWTTEEAIQTILIGHIAGHTESIRAAG
jgi:uncharacterized damage-inducible protein DinB